MTIFSDNPHDRRIERFMTAIPNFKPRGVGVRFSESQVLITITAATPTEILAETMQQIRCPPFRKRFNEYIESEDKPMTYINEKHRARFTLAAKNVHRENYALLSALYLLTADQRLWSCCKHHIINGCVFFENIKLNKNKGGNPIRTSPPKKETAPDRTEAEIIKDLTETEVQSNEPS